MCGCISCDVVAESQKEGERSKEREKKRGQEKERVECEAMMIRPQKIIRSGPRDSLTV